jgi:hypothetical protein
MEHSGPMQKFGDAKKFVRRCPRCQKHGNIKSRDAMPLKSNLQVEIFDVWGVNFMGPFPAVRIHSCGSGLHVQIGSSTSLRCGRLKELQTNVSGNYISPLWSPEGCD